MQPNEKQSVSVPVSDTVIDTQRNHHQHGMDLRRREAQKLLRHCMSFLNHVTRVEDSSVNVCAGYTFLREAVYEALHSQLTISSSRVGRVNRIPIQFHLIR